MRKSVEQVRSLVTSIEGEFRRYKRLAEGALDQLSDAQLATRVADGNSIVILLQHVSGNLKSRFTDFLTSDGEKPWRHRESEFAEGSASRPQLLVDWNDGWNALFTTLADLRDDQLEQQVSIRNEPLTVAEALHRSLAHTSYHVGQIVFVAKALAGSGWRSLSIPPAASRR